MSVKTAKGIIKYCLEKYKFIGWTSVWGTIYVLPGHENDKELLEHEYVHLAQMKKEGKFKFIIDYASEILKHGYRDNKYEIEARKGK